MTGYTIYEKYLIDNNRRFGFKFTKSDKGLYKGLTKKQKQLLQSLLYSICCPNVFKLNNTCRVKEHIECCGECKRLSIAEQYSIIDK